MAKLISAKFPGRCKVCKGRFPAGAPILWDKENGAIHQGCAQGDSGNGNGNSQSQPKHETQTQAKPKAEIQGHNEALPSAIVQGKESSWTIDWSALRDFLKRAVNGDGSMASIRRNAQRIVEWQEGGSWSGFTKNQIRDWLGNGYKADAIQGLSDFTPPLRDKRHYIYAEEGEEIFVDRVLSGEDNFMGQWTKRDRIPGIAFEAEIMFASSVDAKVVNAYNAWICKAAYALESAGIDCQITLKFTSAEMCGVSGENTHTIVRVKQENESTDFWNFSPMLSPAALRAFGFTAMALHADSRGKTADMGMGRGNRNSYDWAVKWDSERRVLTVACPYVPRGNFPEEDMSRQLREALREMTTQG